MIPMLDPMVPEATLLFVISPAFAGVMAALVGAAALAIAGALHELRRTQAPAPPPVTRSAAGELLPPGRPTTRPGWAQGLQGAVRTP
jgi:hypothetical protein